MRTVENGRVRPDIFLKSSNFYILKLNSQQYLYVRKCLIDIVQHENNLPAPKKISEKFQIFRFSCLLMPGKSFKQNLRIYLGKYLIEVK